MKAATKSTLLTAIFLALVSHALLLLINISFNTLEPSEQVVVNVRLQKEIIQELEEKSDPQDLEDTAPAEPLAQKKQIEPPAISSVEVITKLAEPADENSSDHKPIRLSDFKNFLNKDAKNFVSNSPQKIKALEKTFEYKPIRQEAVGQGRDAERQVLLHNSGRVIDENGKHTCFDVVHDLSSQQSGSYIVSNDCTPKTKLVVDIDAPNNG